MFEDYLQDSNKFLLMAEDHVAVNNLREARSYYRASIFYAASALEAFVNYIADTFAKGQSLSKHEIAFLNDKIILFNIEKGLVEKIDFHRLDDKIRLLMYKFVPDHDFNSATWSHFMQFKAFRDSLVHPRSSEDNITISDYDRKSKVGLSAMISIMNVLSTGIFNRPLRKKLLDLIPE
jgi:hypothetical protein